MPVPNLKEDISYWPPGAEDQFGGMTFGAPTTLKGKWIDDMENIITATGQEAVSRAKIYLAVAVADNGFLFRGIVDPDVDVDPRQVPNAVEIRIVGSIPDLSNLRRVWTAFI